MAMNLASRTLILVRRAISAARLGFAFFGTSKTPFPHHVRLFNKRVPLTVPREPGYLNDVINVWLDDEYGLRQLDSKPAAIVDLGANVGMFSLWAANCFPGAVIHAYEPNSRVLPYARANLTFAPAVTVFAEAVGLRAGKARMVDWRESRLASTVQSEGGDVPIVALEQVIDRIGGSVDLLKIDCEGAEWEILEDARSLAKVRSIRMEYHLVGGHTLPELTAKVHSLGFAVESVAPNDGFGIIWLRSRDRGAGTACSLTP